jgi:restriction system protein
MAVPDYQSLMLPVLLASSKGETRIGDVVNQLAEELKLSPEERGELLASGKQTLFGNRVHWAKTYLGKAHLIEITRRSRPATTSEPGQFGISSAAWIGIKRQKDCS